MATCSLVSGLNHRFVFATKSSCTAWSFVQRSSAALSGSPSHCLRLSSLPTSDDKNGAPRNRSQIKYYMQLTKSRLTGLVMSTAAAGYMLSPTLAPSIPTLALVVSGTALVSASANTINQLMERRYDALMTRTACRPLVVNNLTTGKAVSFATVCGVGGTSLLYLCNPLSAALGVGNLLLYTMVYTPLKRVTVANTWVGAVVGGIPPLIGWAAATGDLSFGRGWMLAAILYAWQFPHFNALSWNLRKEYARAGFKMAASFRPDLCRRVVPRYGLLLGFLHAGAYMIDMTYWPHVLITFPLSVYMMWLCCEFYREGTSPSARRLTRFSYTYLALTLSILVLLHQLPADWFAGAETEGNLLCLGKPLLKAGWDLSSLMAFAERFQSDSGSPK